MVTQFAFRTDLALAISDIHSEDKTLFEVVYFQRG